MSRKASAGPGTFGRLITRVIKGQMEQQGMTQAAIAAEIGVSASHVSRIMSFDKEISLDTFEHLCSIIGMTMIEVIEMVQDDRVWSTSKKTTINGREIAADVLTDQELYDLAAAEGATERIPQRQERTPSSVVDMDTRRRSTFGEVPVPVEDHEMPETAVAYQGPDEDALREEDDGDHFP